MRTVGIDVSKATLDLALLDSGDGPARVEHTRLPNRVDDVTAAVAWIRARTPDLIVLEATGPYHAPLLATLATTELAVALVNPARIKAYRQSQGGRHKTDRADAALLACFARDPAADLRRYVAPPAALARLRALVTYRDGLLTRRTEVSNQRAAAQWQHDEPAVLAWLDADLAELAERLRAVDRELTASLAALPEAPVLLAMPGVGLHIAAAVLALMPVDLRGDAKAVAAWAGVHPHLEVSGQRARS
jgi:transposase